MQSNQDFFTRKEQEIGVALNAVQKRAVLRTEGPLLLLASPGSGKTTTLIMRIGYLIEEKGVQPSRIKAVTFSKASASDMKERFKRFFPEHEGGGVAFSTIHSLAFELLREHFRKTRTSFQIIEGDVDPEEDGVEGDRPVLHKKLILRDIFRKTTGENITDDQMEELTTYISFVKNKLLPADEWSKVKCGVPQAERVFVQYEEFKRSGADKLLIDYDDMLVIGNDVLERDRELLSKYRRRYDYVLTDESQDTSMVQHAIVEKLVKEHGNLCVVADDDQSIYSWRAAEPGYLLDFKRVYPSAGMLKMEQNYRSSRNIVDLANRFIKRNKNRYDKNMFTRNPSHKPVVLRTLADYKFQAKYVAQQVAKLENPREAAVLYRNNSSALLLMNEFDRAGIPFYAKDADSRFFSHWVVEDVLNFMRMAFTDKRPDILEKIHTKLQGYITKQQIAALKGIGNNESVFDNLLAHVQLQDYQVKQLQETKETFALMKDTAPRQAIRTIRYKLGYEKAIERMCERLGFRKEFLVGILNTLEDIADGLDTLEDFAKRLKYLETVMKSSKRNRNENAVTFSTLHSAKGLEFERVYMIDLIDGILPSSEEIKKEDADTEEAVRLFYVGMTRAKRHLELLTYKMRDGEKAQESRFMTHVRELLKPPQEAGGSAVPQGGAARKSGGTGQGHAAKPSVQVTGHAASASPGGRALAKSSPGAKPSAQTAKPVRTASRIDPPKPAAPVNPNALKTIAAVKAGDPVTHKVFGRGDIVKVDGETVAIMFKSGLRKFSVATCLSMGLLERS